MKLKNEEHLSMDLMGSWRWDWYLYYFVTNISITVSTNCHLSSLLPYVSILNELFCHIIGILIVKTPTDLRGLHVSLQPQSFSKKKKKPSNGRKIVWNMSLRQLGLQPNLILHQYQSFLGSCPSQIRQVEVIMGRKNSNPALSQPASINSESIENLVVLTWRVVQVGKFIQKINFF